VFDGKAVTAVLVSLAVIAVVTSGGEIQTPDNLGEGGFDVGSLIPTGDSSFENRPTPNNTVEAQFSAELENSTVQVYDTNITSEGLTEIESEEIESDQPIDIRSFTGDINIQSGGEITLVGDAEGYSVSGVSSTENFQLNSTHTTSSMDLQTVKLQHTFNSTSGSITVSEQQSDTGDTVSFNSFTGDIILNFETGNVDMSGRVDRLESGTVTIN